MTKSTAHVDKLGSLSDYKAPWESEAGSDAEIDKGRLRTLIYNVRLDLAKAKDAAEDLKAEVAAKQAEVDTAKQEAADAAGGDAQKTIDKLTRERDDALGKVKTFEERDAAAALRKEVLGDFETDNPRAAKYVMGATKEELEASLEEVKKDFGITDGDPDEEDEEEDEDTDLDRVVRTAPVGRSLLNPADRQNGRGGDAPVDFDAVADQILSGSRTFG